MKINVHNPSGPLMGVADTLYPMRYVEAGEVPGPEGASWAEAGLKRNGLISVSITLENDARIKGPIFIPPPLRS